MKEPVGLSYLFPAGPILNLISTILLLSIIPAFLKTKIFTLIVGMIMLILCNLFSGINMIIWKNNIRDIPIYADIVAHWWSVFPQLLYVNFACFAKFVWYMSRPRSTVFLYDNRQRINRIDAMMLGGVYLLLAPFEILSYFGRYGIMEDFGPYFVVYFDMKAFLLNVLPLTLMVIMSVTFNVMTLRNLVVRRRKGLGGDTRIGSSAQMTKYLLLAISSSVFMVFGNIWGVYWVVKIYFLHMNDHESFPHVFVPVSEVMKTIHRKIFWTRIILDMSPDATRSNGGMFLTIPIVGMYFFAFFGLGKEARKMHRDNIRWIGHLLGCEWQRKEASGLSHTENPQRWRSFSIFKRAILSNRDRMMPMAPFELPSDNSSQPLERMALNSDRSIANKARVADRIDESHQPSLSMHKPPLSPPQTPNTPINEASRPHGSVTSGKRKLSPTLPLLAADSTNDIVQNGLHSLSFPQHKPPMPPLDRHASSINNGQQSQPQFAPLPVPPPAYSRERQYLV
ncbi:hypothetical protein CPB86DRAFT_760397 [Serendipita vermifera]|nr:hypothetical protein CPB86DRAFT_760397 [Serendipita vermifera]